MPDSPDNEITALTDENASLRASLLHCRALLDAWRLKLAANSNDDYRPEDEADVPLFFEKY